MPQDAFTLKYLCNELNEVFKGGKVNRITQPNNDEIVLTIYTGKRTEKLLLNVNPSSPRIGIIAQEKESPLTAPNFCMLMRKHLLSATLEGVELIGFDRIVKIDFTASAEFFDAVKKTVYVELMGRYSNVILTENGKILGGNRGINMFDNGVRPLIVGYPYVFPPVGDKKLPSDIKLIEYFNDFSSGILSEYICKGVQGIALSTAVEIENSYLDKYGVIGGEGFGNLFFEFLNEFLYQATLNPCVTLQNGDIKDVSVFPYKTLTGDIKFFERLYLAEDYYHTERERLKKYTQKKERLTSIVNTAIKKVKKRLTAINAKEKDALSAEENRIKGELLLANIYRIKNGEKECVLENYYDGTQVKIALDERLSVAKNSENYYKKYNKQKRTLTALAPQKSQAETELNYLLSVLDEISLAEDYAELKLVQTELEQAGILREQQTQKRKKQTETKQYNVYLIEGFTVKAGRNNVENDRLTFSARGHDLWLHAKDYHSSHLIIETEGKTVPEKVIVQSAEICAYYSKGRDGGKIEIAYTEKRNVKKPSGAKLGFCTYDNYNTVVVSAEKHTEKIKNNI
ncbi:MAG: NFACT family protein [Clostridia bacterium]|nr:NFACT family protein [Clostridia bacterium]